MEARIITAAEGKIFKRIHDGVEMGKSIHLGYDYSTGEKRLDLPEYYEEIDEPDRELDDNEALNILLGR